MQTLGDGPYRIVALQPGAGAQKPIRAALPHAAIAFVANVRQVIRTVERGSPSLVLVDASDPIVDGGKLLRRLRMHQITTEIPVVMLTSSIEQAEEIARKRLPAIALAKQDMVLLPETVRRLAVQRELSQAFRAEYEQMLAGADASHDELTDAERSVLESISFPVDAPLDPRPLARRAARYDNLVARGLSTHDAAKKLKVNASRIRQRLAARTLYGIRVGNEWRLPAFQFGAKGLIPNVEKVIPKLPVDLDPVAVDEWFRRAHVDLVHKDTMHAPRDWLSQGRSFERVAALAEDL